MDLGTVLKPCFIKEYGSEGRMPFRRSNLSYERLARRRKVDETPLSLLWQFHTIAEGTNENQPVVITFSRTDLKCPLGCGFEAADLNCLWMHMVTTNNYYDFSTLLDKEGTIHIAANPNRKQTPRNQAIGRQSQVWSETEVIFCRSANIFCQKLKMEYLPVTTTTSSNSPPIEPDPLLDQALQVSVQQGRAPIRDYYHNTVFTKITIGEWMLLDPIDTPSDDTWQHRIANSMLDDFNDVSLEEKKFMKLWNAFIRQSNRLIHNKHYKQECIQFLETHAHIIHEEKLEEHLICHLITLWEEHQLYRHEIEQIMAFYSQMLLQLKDNKK